MLQSRANEFAYVAFDDISGAILAHAQTPIHALYFADRAAPDAAIRVVHVDKVGARIWAENMNITETYEAMEKHHRLKDLLTVQGLSGR